MEWHNDIWTAGIDGLHRDTEVHASVAVASGSDSASVPVAQSLRGNGAGLHLRYIPAGRMTLSAGAMRYNYSTPTRQNGTATTTSGNGGLLDTLVGDALRNQPLLAQQLLVQPSGATREAAILQSSWNAGAGYRFDRVAVSAQYFNDKALESDATVNTIKIGAALFLSRHWTLAPAIGSSSGSQSGATGFGVLSTSYNW